MLWELLTGECPRAVESIGGGEPRSGGSARRAGGPRRRAGQGHRSRRRLRHGGRVGARVACCGRSSRRCAVACHVRRAAGRRLGAAGGRPPARPVRPWQASTRTRACDRSTRRTPTASSVAMPSSTTSSGGRPATGWSPSSGHPGRARARSCGPVSCPDCEPPGTPSSRWCRATIRSPRCGRRVGGRRAGGVGRRELAALVIGHVVAACGPLVVVVDQFEECWTRSRAGPARRVPRCRRRLRRRRAGRTVRRHDPRRRVRPTAAGPTARRADRRRRRSCSRRCRRPSSATPSRCLRRGPASTVDEAVVADLVTEAADQPGVAAAAAVHTRRAVRPARRRADRRRRARRRSAGWPGRSAAVPRRCTSPSTRRRRRTRGRCSAGSSRPATGRPTPGGEPA